MGAHSRADNPGNAMPDKPIDKIEAAGRQLDGACRLRLVNDDSLLVHTLGYAAFGILRDLVRHREHRMNAVLDILEDKSSTMGGKFKDVPPRLPLRPERSRIRR